MAISPEQLATLWREQSAGLVLFARTRTEWAEDCVQEAFMRLAVLPSVPTDPKAWLATVVRNLAITKFREDTRRRQRENRYASQQPPWFEFDPLHNRGPSTEELQQALLQLQPEEREIVAAHIWNGLTFRQIAIVFNVPSTTAHRIFTSAVESLRTILESQSKSTQE